MARSLVEALARDAADAVGLGQNFVRDSNIDEASMSGPRNAYDAFYLDGSRWRHTEVVELKYNRARRCFEGRTAPLSPCGRQAHAMTVCDCVYIVESVCAEDPAAYASFAPSFPEGLAYTHLINGVNTLLTGVPLVADVSLVGPGSTEHDMGYLHSVTEPEAKAAHLPAAAARGHRLVDRRWDLYWPPYPVHDPLVLLCSLPGDKSKSVIQWVEDTLAAQRYCIACESVRVAVEDRRRLAQWIADMPKRVAYTAMVLLAHAHVLYNDPARPGTAAAPMGTSDRDATAKYLANSGQAMQYDVFSQKHALRPDASHDTIVDTARRVCRSMYPGLGTGGQIAVAVAVAAAASSTAAALDSYADKGAVPVISVRLTYVVRRIG